MRAFVAALALLCVLVVGPAVALASGPSAGDQQYTDPFASTTNPSKSSATTTTSTSTPMPTTTSTIAANSPSTPSSSGDSSSTSSTSSSKSKTLPYTGMDSLLAGALGGGLLAFGLALRRRAAH